MIKLQKEFKKNPEQMVNLQAYMDTLIAKADEDPRICLVEADLANCDMGPQFKAAHPDRFYDVGIAEQSMSSISAGLSVSGMVPFCHSFAAFASRRMCDQNYISCAYSKASVKIVGSDPAICASGNGGTHQANEDLAIMRAIADMTIIEPTDPVMTKWAVKKAAETEGMFYLRLQVRDTTDFYEEGSEFELGKANIIKDGSDVTLIASGNLMLTACVTAAEQLAAKGISARVVDMFCVKPIDKDMVAKCAAETGAIVTAENHTVLGGLGSAVAEAAAETCPCPIIRIGIQDRFGEVGTVPELQKVMGMTPEDIVCAAEKAIAMKK